MTLKQIWTFKRDMSVKIKTLLALNLIAVIFAVGCGASATKPSSLQGKVTEISSGTVTTNFTTALTANSTITVADRINLTNRTITSITAKDVNGNEVAITTLVNNAGGIYSFTPTAAVTTITYNYVEKSILSQPHSAVYTNTYTSTAIKTFNLTKDSDKFNYSVTSVVNSYGTQLATESITDSTSSISITLSSSVYSTVRVNYTYNSTSDIFIQPLVSGTDYTGTTLTDTNGHAGKTYILQASSSSSPTNGIVPVNGSITGLTTTSKIWVY